MNFQFLGLSDPLLRAVEAAGYSAPSEIQSKAIPAVLTGSDVLGRAKTGSGKTAAFILPVLDRLSRNVNTAKVHKQSRRGRVRALVLVPTRELAQQIYDSTRKYGRFLSLRSDAHFGGVAIKEQIDRLRPGLDVLAATPGRLLDHLQRGSVDLSACEVLIVDEADRMFDMGFINDVKKIIAQIPAKRQTLLFSATINDDIRKLATGIMHDPVKIEIGVARSPVDTVRQTFLSVEKEEKFDLLASLLTRNGMESVLVFSRTKHGADKISKRLRGKGVATAVLHANRSQSQRLKALEAFRRREVRILIATDIAARGIDVQGISHVINFDTPTYAEDYIHRIGRTGRAEASGEALTFVSRDERTLLRRIEGFTGQRFHLENANGERSADRNFKNRFKERQNSTSQNSQIPKRTRNLDSYGMREGPITNYVEQADNNIMLKPDDKAKRRSGNSQKSRHSQRKHNGPDRFNNEHNGQNTQRSQRLQNRKGNVRKQHSTSSNTSQKNKNTAFRENTEAQNTFNTSRNKHNGNAWKQHTDTQAHLSSNIPEWALPFAKNGNSRNRSVQRKQHSQKNANGFGKITRKKAAKRSNTQSERFAVWNTSDKGKKKLS